MTRARPRVLLPLLTTLALAAGAALVRADEPPALPPAPPPAEKTPLLREYSFEGSVQVAWALMGDWKRGLDDLQARSVAAGLPIASSTIPGYTSSFEATALTPVGPHFLLGLQYDRPTGAGDFEVRDNDGASVLDFKTRAQASSNAWLIVGRWMLPGARRGVRPLLQAGAGVGSAQLEFTTPSGGAEGKGHGFIGSIETGVVIGDGQTRMKIQTGWRFHRVPLSYSRVRGASEPGVRRDYFDFDDETRAFVTGRDVDLSGAFARIGVSVVMQK